MSGEENIKSGRFLTGSGNRDREQRAMFLPDGIKRNGTRGGTIMMIMLMIVTMAAHRPC